MVKLFHKKGAKIFPFNGEDTVDKFTNVVKSATGSDCVISDIGKVSNILHLAGDRSGNYDETDRKVN